MLLVMARAMSNGYKLNFGQLLLFNKENTYTIANELIRCIHDTSYIATKPFLQ